MTEGEVMKTEEEVMEKAAKDRRDKDMSGVLFKQSERKTDSSPGYSGEVRIGGKKYKLKGWARTSKANEVFIALEVHEMGLVDDDDFI